MRELADCPLKIEMTVSRQREMMSLQDELQAAVSARASKTKTDQYSYSDDFDDDEDGKMACT